MPLIVKHQLSVLVCRSLNMLTTKYPVGREYSSQIITAKCLNILRVACKQSNSQTRPEHATFIQIASGDFWVAGATRIEGMWSLQILFWIRSLVQHRSSLDIWRNRSSLASPKNLDLRPCYKAKFISMLQSDVYRITMLGLAFPYCETDHSSLCYGALRQTVE
jgi:hypothetical protein